VEKRKYLASTGIRTPDRPTRSGSLYGLSYPTLLLLLLLLLIIIIIIIIRRRRRRRRRRKRRRRRRRNTYKFRVGVIVLSSTQKLPDSNTDRKTG
jgi:hypothetical protein